MARKKATVDLSTATLSVRRVTVEESEHNVGDLLLKAAGISPPAENQHIEVTVK